MAKLINFSIPVHSWVEYSLPEDLLEAFDPEGKFEEVWIDHIIQDAVNKPLQGVTIDTDELIDVIRAMKSSPESS